VGSRAAVPWGRVGPGWALAEFWPGRFGDEGTPRAAAATLYLIDPAGGRYALHRWAATKSPPFLVDWSGDKRRAVLVAPRGAGLEQVVLATGKITRFHLAGHANLIGYTRPDGLNLLGWRGYRLARYSLTGQLTRVLATGASVGSAVYSNDGTMLAAGGPHGVELVSNGGGVLRHLPVPHTSSVGCAAARWWSASTILASCVANGQVAGRLWLVPAGGGAPRALTPQRGARSRDLGDVDAWRLPGGLYLQSLGPCGTLQIFRQAANGSIRLVSIPGTSGDNNQILSARGSRLLVQAQTACPGSESLLWFTPSSRHVQMLLRAPADGAGVLGAVPYGRPVGSF
jgi:TolB protein